MSVEEIKSVYLAQRANLQRFLAARLRDNALAEDLVQELWIKLDRLDDELSIDNLESYLFTMASRLSLDHIRKRQRRTARDEKWTGENTEMTGSFATSSEDDGETRLLRAENIALVHKAITQLTPKVRQAFELHRLKGLSHKQVAGELGISVSTVEKHIIRAMRDLTAILKETEP